MNTFDPADFLHIAEKLDVLKFGEYVLKSGRVSPYFFNAGLLATGEALTVLSQGYAQALRTAWHELNTDPNDVVLFGAAYKGIPFAASTAQTLWDHYQINVDWGYNRKETKQHGEGGQLVGADVTGKQVWILDDVITAGTAMRGVIAQLKQAQAHVAGMVVALDRQERGQTNQSAIQELKTQYNLPVVALVDLQDILAHLQADSTRQAEWARMKTYRDTYGV